MVNYTPEQKKYKNLTPFKLAVLKYFPYIDTADFDALTNYGIMCKLGEHLNTIQDNEKSLEYNVEAQLEAYNNLQKYINDTFDSLNLQEYIDNKLDKMTEDGTLDGIININIFKKFNDKIGYSLIDLGCNPDGVTDNGDKLNDIFNIYKKIYVDDGVFYSSVPINLKSDTTIDGVGTIKDTINIIGTIGDNITFNSIEAGKINTDEILTVDSLLKVYYEETENKSNNKRQMIKVATSNGGLSNNLINFNNNYTVKKINSIDNIKINNITIDGFIYISYGKDIYFDNVTLNNSYIGISYSYNFNLVNSKIILSSGRYIDCQRGSSNCNFINDYIRGGDTPSDNGALKLNEVFYSNIDKIELGGKLSNLNGAYYGIFIDGDFVEDNYPYNPSYYINISNVNINNTYSPNSITINLAQFINLTNINANSLKLTDTDNIKINSSTFDYILSQENNNGTYILNSNIGTIRQVVQNFNFVNCIIKNLVLGEASNNINCINSIIDNFYNTYVTTNSAYNITLLNCTINNRCSLAGIKNLVANIITKCSVVMRELYDSNIKLIIIGNNNNEKYNLNITNISNNIINYMINDDIKTDVPLYLVTGSDNQLTSIKLTNTNNTNNNMTIVVSKNYQAPTDGQHFKGEIVYNSSPAAGGNIGWVCTASGTPGTWKAFGQINV